MNKKRLLNNIFKSETSIIPGLFSIYDNLVGDIPGFGKVEKFAARFVSPYNTVYHNVDKLIRSQCLRGASTAFVTNFGGIITSLFSIPIDLAHGIRTSAAIAHIYGRDIHSDRIKSLCLLSLCGNATQEILREVGKNIGAELTKKAIQNISGDTLLAINKTVGFRLFTKFGHSGVINMGKYVPVIGGVVGSIFTGISTYATGQAAKYLFEK